MGCVFFSLLLHELGHVFAGRLFGARGRILLFWDGGLAIGSNNLKSTSNRVIVLICGPLAQLLFYVLLRLTSDTVIASAPVGWTVAVKLAFLMLEFINLWWAVLNLLPVFPLDGGQLSLEVCRAAAPNHGVTFALTSSALVAGVLALHFLSDSQGRPLLPLPIHGGLYSGLLFAAFCVTSLQTLQFERARRRAYSERMPWER
jgi:Zn-dependent protease